MVLWNVITFDNYSYIEIYNLLLRWSNAFECVFIMNHIDHEIREKIFFCNNNCRSL